MIRKVAACLCSVMCHILKAISNTGSLLVNWISQFAVAEITASVAVQSDKSLEMVLKSKNFWLLF